MVGPRKRMYANYIVMMCFIDTLKVTENTMINTSCISNVWEFIMVNWLSDPFEQEMGVPQGSILSVTLFSLKINSLAKVLSKDVERSLYVDDFLIFTPSHKHKNV